MIPAARNAIGPAQAHSIALALLALLVIPGCGYRVAGQADTIPTRIRTVAVSPFENVTTEYKIEQYMASAVTREFISRTRYQVINDPAQADAKLTGAVVQFFAFPQNLDPVSGRATTVTTITRVQVTLVDRQTGEVLYQNPNLTHREQYQVSADAGAYFEEREAAVARATESMARRLVSAVLEGF